MRPLLTHPRFIYGGLGGGYTIGDVYILSLPGFRFFKANGASSSSAQSTLRADHACARVSASQMISVGGTDGWLGFPDSLMDADPWPRGMALFDLNAAQWTDTYDPALGPYRGPQEVRDWYDGGGLDSVTWNTEKMMEMFASGEYGEVTWWYLWVCVSLTRKAPRKTCPTSLGAKTGQAATHPPPARSRAPHTATRPLAPLSAGPSAPSPSSA
jgi:hypothetical protein